ncbi:MAG: hypothetical protein M3456_00305 [Actinomycetota bacterium]|nr:hypothetical protein [Actinomycetota bacterium]
MDDGARRERNPGVGRQTFGIEQLRDRLGAELVFDVVIEDSSHDQSLSLIGQEQLRFLVAHVPVGHLAHDPSSFRRRPVHAGGDAFDDRGAFELGEHPEHLHHHLARRRRGVERLGRRAQRHAGAIEVLGYLRQLAHVSRQSVDAMHEQKLIHALGRIRERVLKALPLQRRARRLIGIARHDSPRVL